MTYKRGMRANCSRIFCGLAVCLLFATSVVGSTADAMSPGQKALYRTGILAFDEKVTDLSTSACGGSADVSVSGSNNAEKIWNILSGYDLTPVAVAGIMGNFHEESTEALDPAIKQNNSIKAIPDGGDGKTGFGLAQWTSQGRQAALFAKMREAGLEQYYGAGWGHPERDKDIPDADLDKLITVELAFAWEGDTTKIKDIAAQLNAATSTSGDSGSAVLFHRLFEKSADTASMIKERVIAAEQYLNKFGDRAGNGSSCAGELGGVATMDDAVAWAMRFVTDTAAAYHPGGYAIKNDRTESRINLYVTNDGPVSGGPLAGCWRGLYCGQCTALVGWFITKMTGYTYAGGNGGEVVAKLEAAGVPRGSEPRPFSVFSYDTSSVGHTGVVLGTLANGEVITMENNLSSNTLAILKYNIKTSHPDVRFAYVGDKLNVAGVAPPAE